MENLHTVADLAKRYGVRVATIWDWIHDGKIKAIVVGKKSWVRESDLIEFENSHANSCAKA